MSVRRIVITHGVVAVRGTTISPYLSFPQALQEARR